MPGYTSTIRNRTRAIFVSAFFLLTTITIYAGDTYVNFMRSGGRVGSQRNWSSAFIGLSVGAGVPVAEYSKSDSVQGSGYAKVGIHFNATAGIKFMPYLGAMVMAGGTLNPYNTSAISKQDTFKNAPSYSAKPYYLGQYLAGPFVYFTDGETYDFTIRALGGLGMVTFPVITATSSTSSWTQKQTIETPSSKGFGYCVGAGVNFKIGARLGILINADYFGVKATNSNPKTTTDVDFITGIKANTVSVDKRSYVQPIGVLQLSAGISLNF